jgi:hypothetical protein
MNKSKKKEDMIGLERLKSYRKAPFLIKKWTFEYEI